MTKEIVIDIETLSHRRDALIVSVAAVTIDRETLTISEDVLDIAVDLDLVDESKFHISGSTVLWWLRQPQQAREALQNGTEPMEGILSALSEYISKQVLDDGYRIWANGANFDPGILEHAYGVFGMDPNWDFYQVRCVRTLCAELGVNWKVHLNPGEAHDALADATGEAKGLIECFQKLNALKSPFMTTLRADMNAARPQFITSRKPADSEFVPWDSGEPGVDHVARNEEALAEMATPRSQTTADREADALAGQLPDTPTAEEYREALFRANEDAKATLAAALKEAAAAGIALASFDTWADTERAVEALSAA